MDQAATVWLTSSRTTMCNIEPRLGHKHQRASRLHLPWINIYLHPDCIPAQVIHPKYHIHRCLIIGVSANILHGLHLLRPESAGKLY